MEAPVYLPFVYGTLSFVAALGGGFFILALKPTHTTLQVAVSFVSGLMLGVAALHFLPDAVEKLGSAEQAGGWILGGFLSMFFLQRFFHFHHHDVPSGDPEDCCKGHHQGHHQHTLAEKSASGLSWMGTAIGLTLHSLFDGMALAAAIESGAKGHILWAGICVALAVILHKPFDAMAISTLTMISGKSKRFRHMTNALFAAATPVGMMLFYSGFSEFAGNAGNFLGATLAFCAGNFLCIAGSDLLPELQFHSHDRWRLSAALIAGIALAALIGLLGG